MIVSASAWPGFAAVDAVAERLRTLETLVDGAERLRRGAGGRYAPKLPSAVVALVDGTRLCPLSPSPVMTLASPRRWRCGSAWCLSFDAANDPSGRRTRAKKTLADVLGQTRQKLLGWVPAPPTGKPWGDRAAGICGRTSHRDREWSYHLAGRMDLPIQNIKGV